MIYKCTNAYYFGYINKIGGIESHLYYIAKKYSNYDITVFYKNGDAAQINRLRKYVRCIQLKDTDKIICDKLFCCFNREVLKQCEAKEKILVLHGDYKDMVERNQLNYNNLPIDERIDRYLGVSQLVCDSWKDVTGIDATNVYEPVVLRKVKKTLMFISATRLTKEKGWDRMVKLANLLDAYDVNYLWFIYTDSKDKKPTKNMIFCEPRLDITDKLGGFDAFIQLSDNEGFCLSIVEALMRGLPVICTDLPVLNELNLDDSNSIKLDINFNNIPLDKILNVRKMNFNYSAPIDKWADELVPSVSSYEGNVMYKVQALDTYQRKKITDQDLGYIPNTGEIFFINSNRLEVLTGKNPYNESFVQVIKKVKDGE